LVSKNDGREKLLMLSSAGERALSQLNEQASLHIRSLLEPLGRPERKKLIESLSSVRSILTATQKPEIRIVRLTVVNDDALRLLEEYYEAVNLVQRDTPTAIRKMAREDSFVVWLAYLQEKAVGCVVLRALPFIHFAGECKRLYVQPGVRRHGIAEALLDAQEAFARDKGLRWIYLDTHDGLKAAISLYRKRGYRPCKRYNDNPQATVFLRKMIEADRSTRG
jgi:GNAT superfamily N-acetyltransferase